MRVSCDRFINWFTELLLCILTPVCPEPPAAVSCDRPRELELRDLNGNQLTLNELHTPSHSTRLLIIDNSQHLSPNIDLKRRLGASSMETPAYQLRALGAITGRVTTNGR